MGIRRSSPGSSALPWPAAIGAFSGILVAPSPPFTTIPAFLIGLKGFVGAIIGGLASYPVAAPGRCWSVCSNRIRPFGPAPSRKSSSSLIIPVLLWRSLTSRHVEEEDEHGGEAPEAASPRQGRAGGASASPSWPGCWGCCSRPPGFARFTVTLLNYIGLYAIVAVGLVLLTGVGGLTSFGQAAFVGLGRLPPPSDHGSWPRPG